MGRYTFGLIVTSKLVPHSPLILHPPLSYHTRSRDSDFTQWTCLCYSCILPLPSESLRVPTRAKLGHQVSMVTSLAPCLPSFFLSQPYESPWPHRAHHPHPARSVSVLHVLLLLTKPFVSQPHGTFTPLSLTNPVLTSACQLCLREVDEPAASLRGRATIPLYMSRQA